MAILTSVGRSTVALLVNSTARHAGHRGWRDLVRDLLSRRFHLEFVFPRDADDSRRTARQLADQGASMVVAAGGDGTINSVANGLAGTGVPMAILPLGTANDFARELGIPRGLAAATDRIGSGTARTVDLVQVGDRGFCTVGGVGLMADITMAVSRLKARSKILRRSAELLGGGVYRVVSTAHLLGRRQISDHLHLEWEDAADGSRRETTVDAHTLFVANHRTLGGGLVLPVDARGDDGVFELCVVGQRARPSLVLNFARLAGGHRVPPGVIDTHHAVRATIRCDRERAFTADGEVLAIGTEFSITTRPAALRVIA